MTRDEARDVVCKVLHQVAPEADLGAVGAGETLQEGLDLDSVDFLSFVAGLQEETGAEIPERDYPRLSTPEGCVAYLVAARAREER